MSGEASFPYPIPEHGAEPFWEACNEDRLVMQCCDECGRYRWHPSPRCVDCHSAAATWRMLSGRGRIHSWTLIAHPVHPAAVGRVPYAVIEVELDEQPGLVMISQLMPAAEADIAIGRAVEVCFERHPAGQKLPMFRLMAPP